LVKAKIAKLKKMQELRSSKKTKGESYAVRKTGDGTVLILGLPSVGKSTLMNALTNAKSNVADYAFTTLTVIPGLLENKHAKIQILDVPGIVKGAARGSGRGKEVLSVMRSADLVIIIVDVHSPKQINVLKREIYESNIRINQQKPDVKIKKTGKDGIKFGATCKLTKIDKKTVTGILREFKISNAEVVIRENIDVDQFIDCIEDNKKYIPAIVVVNKIDTATASKIKKTMQYTKADLAVSGKEKTHMKELREMIFKRLNLMQIYLKEPGKRADLEEPMIVFKGFSIRDVCNKIHKDFTKKFKFARVSGKSARFPGQKLGLNHKLKEHDILEVHIR
jgi:small GTP-binding protein